MTYPPSSTPRPGPFFGAYGPNGLLVRVFPLDPRPSDVHICSIARGLAGESRFVNQTLGFFSVADHCVEASRAPHANGSEPTPEECFERLMHDASEATLRDMPRPMKKSPEMGLEGYRRAEHEQMAVIALRYEMALSFWDQPHVKFADMLVYRTEVRDFRQPRSWPATDPTDSGPVLPYRLRPTTPIAAERRFIKRFIELCEATGRDAAAAEGREALGKVPVDQTEVLLSALRAEWPMCPIHGRPALGTLDGALVCGACDTHPMMPGVALFPGARRVQALFATMDEAAAAAE